MMVKQVVIHQPDFFPYIGFFDRLVRSEVLVVLDHVQFIKRGWHHRDKIKTRQGPLWLTVPVKAVKSQRQAINEIRISESRSWKRKHLSTIVHSYRSAPYFEEIYSLLENVYDLDTDQLSAFNMRGIESFVRYFGIQIEIVFSSTLKPSGRNNRMLVEIMRLLGLRRYLSGDGARDYMDLNFWESEGMEVVWQEFQHPVYPQMHGEFIPYLSCIDFAMNCGADLQKWLRADGQPQS